jgi:hypothetical protein
LATSEAFGQSPAELDPLVFLWMELEPQAPDLPNNNGNGKHAGHHPDHLSGP